MVTRNKILIGSFFTFSVILFGSWYSDKSSFRNPASLKSKTLFLGVDGLSMRYFNHGKEKLGLFKQFRTSAVHLAPFPSISDYSWNKLMRSTELYGQKGRIKNYEAAYYDHSSNKVIGDSREYFRRIGQENHYYAGGFEVFFNPYIESFLYLPSKKLPKLELDQLKSEILSRSNDSFTSALVASIDAIAHTQSDLIFLLSELDLFMSDLVEKHKELGIDLEIIMVSDHGQAHDFTIGEKPKEMKIADVKKAINTAGFNVDTTLENSNDIAMPVLALGNYISLYFKDLSNREALITKLKGYDWIEHGVYLKNKQEKHAVVVIHDSKGHAELDISKLQKGFKFKYKTIDGNPLRVPTTMINKEIGSFKTLKLTQDSLYPDSFFRIAQAVFEQEADYPDMILTLKSDYRVKGDLDQFVKMYRTHGSLHKDSTNGIIASNKDRNLPRYIRTDDVLDELHIPVETIFKENLLKGLLSNTQDTLKNSNAKTIKTGARKFGSKRVFGLLNRVVNYSQYVFDVDSISIFHELFKGGIKDFENPQGISELMFDFDDIEKVQVLSTRDIAVIMDLVIETPDWKMLEQKPKFKKLKNKVIKELEKLTKKKIVISDRHNHNNEMIHKAIPYSNAAKTLVMKQFSMPFLFKRAFSFPEFEEIPDTRDFEFSEFIHAKPKLFRDFKAHFENPKVIRTLFSEIFNERKIVENIYPQKLKTLYNLPDLEDVTFVYIPGIYNSIFNNEIFNMGVDALKNNFGLRVISPPVLSACDSTYNGKIIIDYIKNDMNYRKDRGRKKHKYFLMGYSKGAVDSLHALKLDKSFSKENINGLVSIAAPLQGAEILTKSDVPLMLLELLGNKNIPKECRESNWASKTITPLALNEFYKKNAKDLIGLTRYYSLSFESDVKDSHIWMQAAKQIAQYSEANDGVVTLSSSKFPKDFSAIDLGVVKADHLAGIVASEFPQVALFEGLVTSLSHIGAFDASLSKEWNKMAVYNSSYTVAQDHREKVNEVKKILDKRSIFNRKVKSKELREIEEKITSILNDTAYSISEFKISKKRKSGKVKVSYHKDSDDFRFSNLFHLNFSEEITSSEEFIDFMLSKIQTSGKDLLVSEKESWRNYPVSSRPKIKLPENSLSYLLDYRINLRNISGLMKGSRIEPIVPVNYPKGFSINYDHQTPLLFRDEYKFNYENSSGVMPDNNSDSGWISHLTSEGEVVGKMSSKKSSIRLTSYAMRFMPKDFKKMKLGVKVTNNVAGANVLFGGNGIDDSAFQVWYTIRVNKPGIDRSEFDKDADSLIFGYYWGDKIKGRELKDNEIYENYYSKKNFIIAVLPPAKQLLIGHKDEDLGTFKDYEFNIYENLKRAFPNKNVDNMEIMAITFQHDSNDAKNDSEAFFKYLKFEP